MIDVLVVGSGPSGAQAAAALVEAGRTVRLLDFGATDDRYAGLVPNRPFSELRRTDPSQHRYFLGEDFEGIPLGTIKEVAQLTPPRLHALKDALERQPIRSSTFRAAESLAKGGLGVAWGAGVFPFKDEELGDLALSAKDLAPHYARVAARIGVSGADDDLAEFYGPLAPRMPPLVPDDHGRAILARYQSRRSPLKIGGTWLAATTEPFRGRDPNPYFDMDFWSDAPKSVYRPRFTIEELERGPGFEYAPGRHVRYFREGANVVEVVAEGRAGLETHRARALVLAAGTLSTARIVLGSLGAYGVRRPLLCNPYAYVPFLHLDSIGSSSSDRRHSLAQLTAVLPVKDRPGAYTQAQIFSYRSLMTFRLLRQAPLAYRDGLEVLARLVPIFGIFGVSHGDEPSPERWCRLPAEGEPLEVEYRLSPEESARNKRETRRLLRHLAELRCVPIREIDPGHGASVHYAGPFPMRSSGEELTSAPDGRLRGTRAVYVADGSLFCRLPPKGLTFTMMALADRIGHELGRALA